MTVVGVLRLDDEFLIAADGQFIMDASVNVPGTKVFNWPHEPRVAWAFSGAQAVAQHFEDWLNSEQFDTWAILGSSAAAHLAQLNGEAVRTAELAGTTTEAVEILLVGYLGGEGMIAYLDREGGFTQVKNDVLFIGGGAGAAYTCWYTAVSLLDVAALMTPTTFEKVLNVAIERTPLLGPPLTVISVKP